MRVEYSFLKIFIPWVCEGTITEDMMCIENCCLSCPYTNNFYPAGELEAAYKIFSIFGMITFFATGGACALACCSAMLMIHLHLITVWNSDFVIRNIRYFNISILFASLAASLIPLLMNIIESDHICFINSQDTTISARKTSNKAKHSSAYTFFFAKNIITVQWRSLLGALLMLIVYIINWVYYINAPSAISSGMRWSMDWFECLQKNNSNDSQNICAYLMKPYVPPFSWTITLLFFNRFLGILIFIIFAVKKCIFLEMWNVISRKPVNEREVCFDGKTLKNVKSNSSLTRTPTNELTKNSTVV
ncbi:6893_t:CDS:2 [Diversispora eburnea]|uniref:6893_t:CDS:1 n=1 Tax=Diversispora eburnea TaxID=1213867 RepID=A0A9N8V2K1_9GLOM|nr:6893_t:CDS:2 [Diversispora eburnea]